MNRFYKGSAKIKQKDRIWMGSPPGFSHKIYVARPDRKPHPMAKMAV